MNFIPMKIKSFGPHLSKCQRIFDQKKILKKMSLEIEQCNCCHPKLVENDQTKEKIPLTMKGHHEVLS